VTHKAGEVVLNTTTPGTTDLLALDNPKVTPNDTKLVASVTMAPK